MRNSQYSINFRGKRLLQNPVEKVYDRFHPGKLAIAGLVVVGICGADSIIDYAFDKTGRESAKKTIEQTFQTPEEFEGMSEEVLEKLRRIGIY